MYVTVYFQKSCLPIGTDKFEDGNSCSPSIRTHSERFSSTYTKTKKIEQNSATRRRTKTIQQLQPARRSGKIWRALRKLRRRPKPSKKARRQQRTMIIYTALDRSISMLFVYQIKSWEDAWYSVYIGSSVLCVYIPSIPAAARRGLQRGEPKDGSRRAVSRQLRGRSHGILGTGIPKLKGLLPLHARRP